MPNVRLTPEDESVIQRLAVDRAAFIRAREAEPASTGHDARRTSAATYLPPKDGLTAEDEQALSRMQGLVSREDFLAQRRREKH